MRIYTRSLTKSYPWSNHLSPKPFFMISIQCKMHLRNTVKFNSCISSLGTTAKSYPGSKRISPNWPVLVWNLCFRGQWTAFVWCELNLCNSMLILTPFKVIVIHVAGKGSWKKREIGNLKLENLNSEIVHLSWKIFNAVFSNKKFSNFGSNFLTSFFPISFRTF